MDMLRQEGVAAVAVKETTPFDCLLKNRRLAKKGDLEAQGERWPVTLVRPDADSTFGNKLRLANHEGDGSFEHDRGKFQDLIRDFRRRRKGTELTDMFREQPQNLLVRTGWSMCQPGLQGLHES